MRRLLIALAIALLPSIAIAYDGYGGGYRGGWHRITPATFRKTSPTVIEIAALTSTKMARVICVDRQKPRQAHPMC